MNRYAFIGPALLLAAWALAAQLGFVDTFFLPGPAAVANTLLQLLAGGSITSDLAATATRVGVSFAIAAGAGVPLGLMLGGSEKVYRSIEFVIDFFRSTPATALFPFFLLVFGITDISKVAVAAFAALLVIVFNTAYGVMHARQSRILAARIMGASRLQVFRYVTFWESLPQTFVGLRSAVSLALVVIVVTEMFIGTSIGLGRRIIDAQITYEIPTMYAAILLAGIMGYALNLLFVVIEKRYLHWDGK